MHHKEAFRPSQRSWEIPRNDHLVHLYIYTCIHIYITDLYIITYSVSGNCPCPWQGFGLDDFWKHLPTQTILLYIYILYFFYICVCMCMYIHVYIYLKKNIRLWDRFWVVSWLSAWIKGPHLCFSIPKDHVDLTWAVVWAGAALENLFVPFPHPYLRSFLSLFHTHTCLQKAAISFLQMLPYQQHASLPSCWDRS